MNRTDKEEYIIGSISLLSNKLAQVGDMLLPDITYKQWFLLIMISKMDTMPEKNINCIAKFIGTTRQSVKKMLTPLEVKGYVAIGKSTHDKRALNVELTDKTYQYFADNADIMALETNQLFKQFTLEEIDDFVCRLDQLMGCLALHEERKNCDE